MIAGALLTSRFYREATIREGKRGSALATLCAEDESDMRYGSVLTSGAAAQAELGRLAVGEACSVQGALRVAAYEALGITRFGLSIFANHVLSLRRPTRERQGGTRKPAPRKAGSPGADMPFDNDTPF
jgi:hypothetical protein